VIEDEPRLKATILIDAQIAIVEGGLRGATVGAALRGRPSFRHIAPGEQKQKSAAVFAVRRANYTHRRKGVFNAEKYRGSGSGWQCALSNAGCPQILETTNYSFVLFVSLCTVVPLAVC